MCFLCWDRFHYIHIHTGWCFPAVSPAFVEDIWLELKAEFSSQVWIQQRIYIHNSVQESTWPCWFSGLPISLKVRMCLSASLEQGSVLQPRWNTQSILLFWEVITAWKRYFSEIEGNKCPRALIHFTLGLFSPLCNFLLVPWLITSTLSIPHKISQLNSLA